MLVLTLLLLMPTIPAIQHKTIQENTFQNYIEKHNEMIIQESGENNKNGFWDHPFIYFLGTLGFFRTIRGFFMVLFSASGWGEPYGEVTIDHPILFCRGIWLYLTGAVFGGFLLTIAYILGWEW